MARLVIRDFRAPLSAGQRAMIEPAFESARIASQRVRKEMEAIWDQPGRVRKRRRRRRDAWRANALFVKWFGSSTHMPLIRRVRRRIRRIDEWLDRARIVVVIHDSGRRHCDSDSAFALVPRRPLRVHLCPGWFATDNRSRAAIVVHELVHQLGHWHPERTKSAEQARRLASRNSRKARRSPENFEHLYREFL